jgi:hypothetical protein
MEVLFSNGRLDRSCRTRAGREQAWDSKAAVVARLLFELSAVANLADAALLPGTTLGPDTVDGRFRMRFRHGIELVLRPTLSTARQSGPSGDLGTVVSVTVEDVLIIGIQGGM